MGRPTSYLDCWVALSLAIMAAEFVNLPTLDIMRVAFVNLPTLDIMGAEFVNLPMEAELATTLLTMAVVVMEIVATGARILKVELTAAKLVTTPLPLLESSPENAQSPGLYAPCIPVLDLPKPAPMTEPAMAWKSVASIPA